MQVINNDRNWPATRAAVSAYRKRCASCHGRSCKRLPVTLSDENGLSFWMPNMSDPRLHYNRHVLFNLSRPEKSLYLKAPLSKSAGGLGLCRGKGPNTPVFSSTDDPDYQVLLAMITAGKKRLEEVKRFDMPGFKPLPQYIREMKRYGVLPQDYDPKTSNLTGYDMDRMYWDSFIYRAKPKK